MLGYVLVVLSVPSITGAQSSSLSKYNSVEAYAVRPGILAMASYTGDGQLCEVGLEARHYSQDKIKLAPDLSRKDVDEIFNELAPPSERGPKVLGDRDLITTDGVGMVTSVEYENASLQLYAGTSTCRNCSAGNVAAVIRWKKRKCR